MKNILLRGVVLAAILIFLFKGGIRLLFVGWKLFVPMLLATGAYYVVRSLVQQNRLKARSDAEPQQELIVICPHCNKPKGSCPKCS